MAILVSSATSNSNNALTLISNDTENKFFGTQYTDNITYNGTGKLIMLDVSNGDKITVDDTSAGFKAWVSGNTVHLTDSNGNNGITLGAVIAGESVTINFDDHRSVLISVAGSTYTAESGGSTVTLTGTAQSVFAAPNTASLTATAATALLNKGLQYSPITDITITGTGTELATLAPLAHNLGGSSIMLDASNNAVSLTLLQVSNTLAYGGVTFANNDVIAISGTGNPMALAPSLIELGGTSIQMDVNVDTANTVAMDAANAGSVSSGHWYFNATNDDLTYWNSTTSAAKTIDLTGVNTVTVSGAGLMVFDI